MRLVHLIAAATIALSPTAAAAVPTLNPAEIHAQADTVVIPFDPPLDRKLTYRMNTIKVKDGIKSKVPLELTVEFARDGDEYLMTVVYLLPPALRDVPHPALALLKRPLVFRLDRNAVPVGFENEESYWTGVAEALKRMPEAKGDPRAGPLFAKMVEDMRSMPDKERLWFIGKNVLPIVELASIELTPDEPVVSTEEVQGVFGGRLTRTTTLVLGRIEGDTAHVSATTIVPAEQLGAMVGQMFSRMAPERLEELEQEEIPGVKLKADYQVSLSTGLVTSFHTVTRPQSKDGAVQEGYSETRTLELVR